MCGIVGVVGKHSAKYKRNFLEALKSLKHRGRDHSSYKEGDNYL